MTRLKTTFNAQLKTRGKEEEEEEKKRRGFR
jgi:hypothetical protein